MKCMEIVRLAGHLTNFETNEAYRLICWVKESFDNAIEGKPVKSWEEICGEIGGEDECT